MPSTADNSGPCDPLAAVRAWAEAQGPGRTVHIWPDGTRIILMVPVAVAPPVPPIASATVPAPARAPTLRPKMRKLLAAATHEPTEPKTLAARANVDFNPDTRACISALKKCGLLQEVNGQLRKPS